MILIVKVLETNISQTIDLSLKEYKVKEIKPYIYMHNSPSGTFKIEILSGVNVLKEVTFTSASIKSSLETTDNYAHVFLPLETNLSLASGEYIVRLSATDYNFNNNSYLGWVKEWEGFYYDKAENPLNNPHSIRLITNDNQNFKLS